MVDSDEYEKVAGWCEQKKKERARIYLIERNSFSLEMRWMMRFPLIEIDVPKERAKATSLVYDSTTKSLWEFTNGIWRRIERDKKDG
ncbi:MAG: hypothetical protein ACP5NX_02785 [Candidatus Bilamarchaeaceae archaeon]